jgi:hypothetical protein
VADVARAPAAKLANGRKHEPPMSEQNVDEDDGDPTSSLPWSATGRMTYRAENQKAREQHRKKAAKYLVILTEGGVPPVEQRMPHTRVAGSAAPPPGVSDHR